MGIEQFVTTFSASGQPPKETCRQCRFRKVKCDGRRSSGQGCGGCARLKFDCSFAITSTAAPLSPTSTQSVSSSLPSPTIIETGGDTGRVVERRRTSKACTHCRVQKIRCSGGTPCLSCKKKAVVCAYSCNDRRRGSRVGVTASSSSTARTPVEGTFPGRRGGLAGEDERSAADDISIGSTSKTTTTTMEMSSSEHLSHIVQQTKAVPLSLLPPELQQQLVDFYFRHIYALPSYAFMHPQTTIKQCREGELDPCLSYAISAVASHHMGPSRVDAARSWIQAAEELIWQHLDSPTLPRIQALFLIVLYRVETGSNKRAFMLSSIAARAAAAMRLNYERTPAPSHEDAAGRISREVRRRVMWSLKFVERYFCMGLPEFELCPVEAIYLNLPCSEEQFSSDSVPSVSERNLQNSDYASYQLCVKLEMLRRDIVKLTRSLSVYDAPFPQLDSLIHGFEQHLQQIGKDLPNGAHGLTADRISQLLDTPWLARQVLVHLSYHQAYSDIYRILLEGYREAAPAIVLASLDRSPLENAEHLSLQHATAIVDILATLNQQSTHAQLLEFDTAICGYHATRVLLFIAQFGKSASRPSEEWALSRAELCMASLRRFFSTSRLVRPILEEMKRMIELFASRSDTTTPSRLASPGAAVSSAEDSSMGLSAAARVRQRLAIHSLLRQADFTEDGDAGREEGRETVSPGMMPPTPTHSAAGLDMLSTVASADFASSPGALSPDGDIWDLGWLQGSNGGVACQWTPGGGSRAPSHGDFTFPWMKRWSGFKEAV